MLIHDLPFLNEEKQQAIKDLERQLVDAVADLLVRLDAERQIVKRTEDLYDDLVRHHQLHLHLVRSERRDRSREFADMAVEVFMNGFAPGRIEKAATTNRREKV